LLNLGKEKSIFRRGKIIVDGPTHIPLTKADVVSGSKKKLQAFASVLTVSK
jgi:hypothetical protein